MTSIRWPLVSLVAAVFALATALWPAPAAELLTAEVDGTAPIDVTVEQGATASFTIYVSASGSIRCTNTAANPSSARVHTSYAIDDGGAISSDDLSSSLSFFATGSGTNCPITWNDPDPSTPGRQAFPVPAVVSIGALTPLGDYSVVLSTASGRTQVSNPNATGGKLEDNTSTTLIFHVIAPPPPADTTPPVIVPQVTPAPNAGGWNNTDVSVTWSVTDAESTVSSSSGCGPSTLTDGTAGETLNCSATSAGGTAGESVTIRIDKTAPQISGGRSLEPNANGWNNTSVAVSFNCTDTGAVQSGIATDTVAGDTVTTEGAGQSVTNSGACVDNAGNIAPSATVGDINIDQTPPQISGSGSPEPNSNGWNNTDVTVSFTCTDAGAVQSGIATDTVAGDTVTSEGDGRSVINSGACVDNAGNAALSATVSDIKIDKTNPQITGSRDPEANANGWNNTDVAVSFTCDDTGAVRSGIATDTVTGETVTAEGIGQSVTNSGDCVDNAGNAASPATVSDINVDKTSPAITGSRDPEANANDWNNTDVVVSFTCADAGAVQSGIATDTVAGDILADEAAGQSVTNSGDCVDNAGNATLSATMSGINIDKTNPVISGSRDPEANANGWNNTDVTVHYDCTDGLSLVGLLTPDQVVSTEGAGQSRSGNCTDNAGNSASASVLNINIDKTQPTIAITGFSDGAAFYTGQSLPVAGCATPEDSLSGVALSNGPSSIAGGLNANGVGYVSYECSATDLAGNAASDNAGFSVFYGGVTGILQPINPDNSSVFKRGQAVPVKFRLAGDEFSGFATGDWTLKRIQVSCATLAELTVVENVSSVTPSSTFRYDASADQYIYNADFRSVTPGTCWRVKVTLDDGTSLYSAYFKVNR